MFSQQLFHIVEAKILSTCMYVYLSDLFLDLSKDMRTNWERQPAAELEVFELSEGFCISLY